MQKRRSIILAFCFILLAGLIKLEGPAKAEGTAVTISTHNLNVRQGPGLSYPILGQAQKGDRFNMLSQKGEWIEIAFQGKKGWVASWLVSVPASSQGSSANKGSGSHAIITTDGLRVRNGPGTGYAVLGTVHKKAAYKVLESKGNWIKLQTPHGDGWVSGEYVQNSSQNKNTVNGSSGKTGKITANSLNIRSKPSLHGAVTGKLNAGDIVTVISQNGSWTEVAFSGNTGWVSSQYVEVQSSQSGESNSALPNIGKTGTVTATALTVRNKGSLSGKPIGSVSKGQAFSILEEMNNWSKIEYQPGSFGWVASWFLEQTKAKKSGTAHQAVNGSSAVILHNGLNIRKSAGTHSSVIHRANKGDSFDIISLQNDWYEIRLPNGQSGYVAGWIVSVNGSAPKVEKQGAEMHLKNKTIVLDPGHGGRDNGTTGARGTLEKTLTLRTAQLLYEKLRSAGANVILTRNSDSYLPLPSRVGVSHYHNADAFISIHYDSIADRTVRGMTTYYYHSFQKSLASNIHSNVTSMTNLRDRGYRLGDYHVIRENKRNAVLLELGYLSNPAEEILITSAQYQQSVAAGIYQGLARYFKN
ncbi:SH3 domain-containing protein [Bacillus sp. ISL-47]|uniref:SH3 domain-containing protein n=1 Tax=Bacillus sp. ISL-47 TaxID=2819130 RepID=UPI001BE99091|nr:SH3 domain-containing protein [Bacillus sp. ISL-47]MBT2688044.1 SH3 domain-containing protein [Bacillus sp. ISL-47]MBT2707946.1 SH3 domain-containing protein [Pseudomonas sp. ISL-84]